MRYLNIVLGKSGLIFLKRILRLIGKIRLGQREKLSICHLITSLEAGGAEVMLRKLLLGMDRSRFVNQVVCLSKPGRIGEELIRQGIPVHYLDLRNYPLSLSRFYRLLRFPETDILQTWLYHADLVGLALGKLSGVKNICWNIRCSYMDFEKYRIFTRWTVRACSILSFLPQAIIANSRAGVKHHIGLGYKAKRWEIIPNGFDLSLFKPDENAKSRLLEELGIDHDANNLSVEQGSSKPFLIGFIARYDPMKDHNTFIEAAVSLIERGRNAHFILAGRGITWQNHALIKEIPDHYKKRFHLLGERTDLERIYPALDIACCISLGEGFPNVVGEAMASGVPCVVTGVGDSAEVVGDTGRVIPLKNVKALVNAWEELFDMGRKTRHKLGKAARKRVEERYEISCITKRYECLYTRLAT